MTFPSISSIIVGLIFGLGVALLAYQVRALSSSGTVAAAVLGWVVFGLGGWDYTIILLIFFLTSSGLSFAFKKLKSGLDEKHAKGSRRDASQVLANGGAAGLMVILHVIFPNNGWIWWAYCASLAAANADTWATELGVLSPDKPRLITTGRQVEMGTSGGITWVGTLAALAGSFVIGLAGFILHPDVLQAILLVSFAGLAGSLVDSLLGATIQSVYFCPNCQKETERHPLHSCGTATSRIRGFEWMDNDWVNGFCTFSGVIFILIAHLLKLA